MYNGFKNNMMHFFKAVDIYFLLRAKFLLCIGHFYLLINLICHPRSLSISSRYKIWGRMHFLFYGSGSIKIGNNFRAVSHKLRSYITLYSPCKLSVIGNGKIVIGDNVGINGTVIVSRSEVSVGDNTMIAPNVIIMDHNGHNPWPIHERWLAQDTPKKITIGKNVWIGMNTLILKGVNIGNGAVIAAGSVVTKNVRSNSLYAGSPAKFIKSYIG